MKKILISFLLLTNLLLNAQNTPTAKYGFINSKGKVVIPLKYEMVGDFNDGYAVVLNSNKELLIIDKAGKETPIKNKNYVDGFIKSNGGYIFSEGVCVVANKDVFGVINTKGVDVIPCNQYLDSSYYKYGFPKFQDGILIYKNLDKKEIIDKKGEPNDISFMSLSRYRNKLFTYFDKTYKFGVIDLTGKGIVNAVYENIWIEDNGVIRAYFKEKKYDESPTDYYCLFNYNGEEIPNTRCTYISNFENGFALYANTNDVIKWGVMNAKGTKTPFKEKYLFSIKKNPRFENGFTDGYNPLTKSFEILDTKGNRVDLNCNRTFKSVEGIYDGIILDYNKAEKSFSFYDINTCSVIFENIKAGYSNPDNLKFKNGYAIICQPLKDVGEERKFMIIDRKGKVTYTVEGQTIYNTNLKHSAEPGIFIYKNAATPKDLYTIYYVTADGTVLYKGNYNSKDFREGLAAVGSN